MRRAITLAAAATLAAAQSPTATPSPSSGQSTGRFACDSFLVLVVGSGTATVNTAQIVYIEERQRGTGNLLRRFPLRYVSNGPTEPACTLAVAGSDAASDLWLYDMDGMPATSADGTLATVICFNINAGSTMSLDTSKTIASIHYDGTVTYTNALSNTYLGVYGPAGVRQAVTVDGTEYWTSGVSESDFGFRYVASDVAGTSVSIFDPNDMFLPGYSDARGLGVIDGSLYISTTNLDPPQFQGIIKVDGGLPRAQIASPTFTIIPTCTVNTFFFNSPTSVWVAANSPTFAVGTLAHYVNNAGSWEFERAITLETVNPVYSVTGRVEVTGFNLEELVIYASSPTKVYRYVPRTNVTTAIFDLLAYYPRYGAAVRGVALAPRALDACSPSPTPSSTSTGSTTSSGTATPTQTASSTQTRTPSSSQTRTPSSTQTGTGSSSQTRTPSASRTQTPTESSSPTSSPSMDPSAPPTQSMTMTMSMTPTTSPTPSVTPSNCALPCCNPNQHITCCHGRTTGHGVCPRGSPSASPSPGFAEKCCACDCSCGYILKPKAVSETAARRESYLLNVDGTPVVGHPDSEEATLESVFGGGITLSDTDDLLDQAWEESGFKPNGDVDEPEHDDY